MSYLFCVCVSHPLFNKMDKERESGLVSSDRNHPMEKLSIRGLNACRNKTMSHSEDLY